MGATFRLFDRANDRATGLTLYARDQGGETRRQHFSDNKSEQFGPLGGRELDVLCTGNALTQLLLSAQSPVVARET